MSNYRYIDVNVGVKENGLPRRKKVNVYNLPTVDDNAIIDYVKAKYNDDVMKKNNREVELIDRIAYLKGLNITLPDNIKSIVKSYKKEIKIDKYNYNQKTKNDKYNYNQKIKNLINSNITPQSLPQYQNIIKTKVDRSGKQKVIYSGKPGEYYAQKFIPAKGAFNDINRSGNSKTSQKQINFPNDKEYNLQSSKLLRLAGERRPSAPAIFQPTRSGIDTLGLPMGGPAFGIMNAPLIKQNPVRKIPDFRALSVGKSGVSNFDFNYKFPPNR